MAEATIHRPPSEMLPRIHPPGWSGPHPFDLLAPDGSTVVGDAVHYDFAIAGMRVIMSLDTMEDGKRWLHLSLSHRSRYPTWDEIREAKNWVLGRERVAYQVLPRESQYVNYHGNTFHLWSPLDGGLFPGD